MGMNSGSARSGGSSKAVLSEINVTPLVDVMLVLLIMFMVTTPLMQQGIQVDLPKTSATGLELKEEPLLIVIEANQKISIAKHPIPLNQLKEKLTAIFKTRKNKQVYIQADRRVDYGVVAEAMAETKAAGIHNLGLVTLPREK
ncbi:MAG: biopolymer transporter ExbD [Bdellovibrionaceae bacterium]|nr:biopolymer transporter ExbD [Pseudobdellovibrionaceae bacterium]NUM58124.1 biopolymer transporter ExbD [Pseudobdellovibrionaceae bacterium]